MKYKSEIRPDRQAGFGLMIGVFIIVIMALLVASMLKFYETETQAGSTELMSLRAFEAASSLSEFGLRRALLDEKCETTATGVEVSCDEACVIPTCRRVPVRCDDPTTPGPEIDDVSFDANTLDADLLDPKSTITGESPLVPGFPPDSASPPPDDPQARDWKDEYMGFCTMVSLNCGETQIGVQGVTEAKDSYFVVKGTVECSIKSDASNVYSVERFTVETGAKLTATEKVARVDCQSVQQLGASGKTRCDKPKKVK